MVDWGEQRELFPHYVITLVILFSILAVLRRTVGEVGIWGNLAVAVVIVLVYPSVVRFLGVAPSVWEK